MSTGGCAPSGCQCRCHNPPPGIEIKHMVACCNPADELVRATEELGLYDDDPFVSDSVLRYNDPT
jgi:hypothetical protein